MKLMSTKPGRSARRRALSSCLCLLLPLAAWCVAPPGVAGQERAAEADVASRELDEALALYRQFLTLYGEGRYAEALPLAGRVLKSGEKLIGTEHPQYAGMLSITGRLHHASGDYAAAESFYRRALDIYEKATEPYDADDLASLLSHFGTLHYDRGDFAEAERLHGRALDILEKVVKPDDPALAAAVVNLAEAHRQLGEFARAEPLFLRALPTLEKALGAEHSKVASALNNLAQLYHDQGDLVQAETLYRRVLAIREKVQPPDPSLLAQALQNLGVLYADKGDFAKAGTLYRRALEIAEKLLGPEHPEVTYPLSNLASAYQRGGDHAKAELYYRRALAIREKAYGPGSPHVATVMDNLASVYDDAGDLARAESLCRRALDITEKALGPEHPDVATRLNNLAGLLFDRGEYAAAETLYRRALAIREKAFGRTHPYVGFLLDNLSAVYLATGDLARALQFKERADENKEHNLSLILDTGSERQKFAYLDMLSATTDGTVSLHTLGAPADPRALELALTTVLRRKGRALDAMSGHLSSLRRRLEPQDRALLDKLSAAQTRLAALVLDARGDAPAGEHRAAVARLEEEVEQLQDAVSRRSAEFGVQTRPVSIEQVRQALPPGAALVEFFSYGPYDVRAKTEAERFRPARYVAYVLPKEGAPAWADLGEESAIDADVVRLLAALRCPQGVGDLKGCPAVAEVKRLARAVDERLMRPVRRLLSGSRQVFVSPDGALNLLPFAALVDEGGRYLVEGYSLTYLTSGRDLLRLQLPAESLEPPLVVADPAFGKAARAGAAAGRPSRSKRSGDLVEVDFGPLPGTAAEARALASLLPAARVLTQARATEAALKQARGPRVLHVATHGFFLPDREPEGGEGGRGLRLSDAAHGARVLVRSENPLLRSGLALAGANLPPAAGEEDGILTALEAAGLELRGTKLVVLSACETGVGHVRNGEGVYGLRRALVLAGAESQVMSLWQVSDAATRDLMAGYYKLLLAGEGRTEALRHVQLKMLGGSLDTSRAGGPASRPAAAADYSHPYYWAGFIQSGDWRGMNAPPAPQPK